MTDETFQGFGTPKQNWSKLPHTLIAALPTIKSASELKVILYILRHTWGFHETEKRISLDEFANGRKKRGGERLDGGTGMSIPAIRSGIKRAIEHGFISVETDDSDKARVKKYYSLNQTVRKLQSDCKKVTPRVKDSCNRTKKETVEINQERHGADAPAAPADDPTEEPRFFDCRYCQHPAKIWNDGTVNCEGGHVYNVKEPPVWPWECGICGKRAAINKDNIVNCPHCDASYHRESAPNQEPPICPDCLKPTATSADMPYVGEVCICKQAAALVEGFGDPPERPERKPPPHWREQVKDERALWGFNSPEFQRQLAQYGDAGRKVRLLGYDWEQLTQLEPDWEDKQAIKSWSSGLWACLKAAGGDASIVLDATRKAIEDGLTISDPYSVVKMTRALCGERKRGPIKARPTPMLDQSGLDLPNPLAR